ncbi:sugar MFS transporter [Neptunomonas phycophila]|uniref:sugar MFS transporter n=1 Tax=Neptunomonas phycophila TaxID=1572645 RepID=UPI000948D352|nr:sugar MFS transporter [Neptunomonas phycophila]
MATPASSVAQANLGGSQGNFRFALISLTSLFFMWGFITSLNDILIPHLKNIFDLSYTQAMLIQFCFFGAYFVMSLPSGALVHRLGYKMGVVIGLLTAAAGALLFIPAASFELYPLFLGALFVMASGITLLQVSANPYVTILGSAKTASSRLNLTQAFNSLGTTVAPAFGALLILAASEPVLEAASSTASEIETVKVPYLIIAGALILLAIIFAVLKLPRLSDNTQTDTSEDVSQGQFTSAWQYSHLVLGAVAIFMYVGGEVAIGSFLINFLGEPDIAGLAETDAAHYVAYYWGGAMVGRFIGSALMTKLNPAKLLAFNAVGSVLLILIATFGTGQVAMVSILLVGLCNSIMFPTIFSLAVRGLGVHTSQGSGILCLAIVGGAIVPLIQGVAADAVGLQLAFIVPAVCYLYIVFYGLKGSEIKALN